MRISTKISVVVWLLSGIFSLIFGLTLYNTDKSHLLSGIDERLHTAVTLAHEVIGPDYHSQITGPESLTAQEYTAVVDRWNRLSQELNLAYIWSISRLNGKTVFTSSTSTSKQLHNGDYAEFLEEHTNPQAYSEVFQSATPRYKFIEDKWGDLRVALIPFTDTLGRPYLICAAAPTEEIRTALHRTLLRSIGFGSCMLLIGLTLSILISRSLAHPITALTQAVKDITQGVCDHVEVDTHNTDELKAMAAGIQAVEEKVQANLSELRHQKFIIRSAATMIAGIDLNGNLTDANPAFLSGWGYDSVQQIIGRPISDFWDVDEIDVSFFKPSTAEETYSHTETHARRRDGSVFDVILSIATLLNDHKLPVGMVISSNDISQRKREEAALEKKLVALTQPLTDTADIKFENLFNLEDIQELQDQFAKATGVASIITRPDGSPITRPSNFCRLCEKIIRSSEKGCANCYKSDSELGKLCFSGPTVQHCMSGSLWDAGAGISVGGTHVANWLIGQVRDSTQSEESIREYARKIDVDEDEAAAAFAEVTAMTLEHFTEISKALYTLANQLSTSAYQNIQQARFIEERRIAEEELRKSEEKLHQSQKMEAIGQLAGGIAHDFNNILGGIMGSAELIRKSNPSPEESRELSDMIIKSAERAAELTQNLLTFARKQPPANSIQDIHQILADTAVLVERTIDRRIRLTLELTSPASTVKGDAAQLQSAFLNLAINAAHSMNSRGDLTLSTRQTELDADDCDNSSFEIKPGSYLEITVRDTGCGIHPGDLPHIFEPFFTTKTLGKGTGLGLSAVLGTIQQHGGEILIESELNKGTCVTIHLPTTEIGNALTTTTSSQQDFSGTESILVIDDEPIVRTTATAILANLGYDVQMAKNGREGIEKLQNESTPFDLVILDMIMPEMNGRDCFEELIRINPHQRVILSSGYTPEEELKDMQDMGLNAFIRKPFRTSTLAKVVHDTLNPPPSDQK